MASVPEAAGNPPASDVEEAVASPATRQPSPEAEDPGVAAAPAQVSLAQSLEAAACDVCTCHQSASSSQFYGALLYVSDAIGALLYVPEATGGIGLNFNMHQGCSRQALIKAHPRLMSLGLQTQRTCTLSAQHRPF